ncbi:50S ribosomal protein L29 [Patescibacteria group bacterium]|nr:50S ribosomal protein L29 [Patescibacteria group bacterium]
MAHKILPITDLRKMNVKDLSTEETAAKAELAKIALHVRVGEDKKSHMVKGLRKYIARINTVKLETQANEN